jgi:hypothetical protein
MFPFCHRCSFDLQEVGESEIEGDSVGKIVFRGFDWVRKSSGERQ